jgi:GNAT superfamily N-acetyltransferase
VRTYACCVNPEDLSIQEESIERLDEHASISIAFLVERILAVSLTDGGLGGVRLLEAPVASPWTKDYDAIKGEGPTRWPKRFDISTWGLLAAYDVDSRIGGAVVALGLELDRAILWDLRVHPEYRSLGVGSALFRAVEEWSRSKGCRSLKIETQNVNLVASRFYVRMGCELGAIDRFAYPDLPDETQLLWVKDLT